MTEDQEDYIKMRKAININIYIYKKLKDWKCKE